MGKLLYDTDFYLWSAEQGQAIRDAASARINTPSPIDWDNVAEEIESLGRSERAGLHSRIDVIVEHLMKLQASPAQYPRADWMATIRTQRREIQRLLEASPSLRRNLPNFVSASIAQISKDVTATLADHKEQPLTDITQLSYTTDQVLSDWFPD